MIAIDRARRWQRAAIKRQWAIVCCFSLPLLAAVFAVLLARVGLASALLAVLAGLALAVISLRMRIIAHDTGWLIQRLDAEPILENSSDLLFADTGGLSSLQRLQRERTQARLLHLPEQDWRQAWPMQAIGLFMLLTLAVLLAGFWPESAGTGGAIGAAEHHAAGLHRPCHAYRKQPASQNARRQSPAVASCLQSRAKAGALGVFRRAKH
jgi:hypothetical protein